MAVWQVTEIFRKNYQAKTRYILNAGGTRSSKSISILQVLYRWCELNPNRNFIISCVSETMPHLKKGIETDFFDRLLKPFNLYNAKHHNKTDHSYQLFGNKIEFFSADSADKVHGPGRHILFYNELQSANYETFFHLVQRTEMFIYADWNPTHEFFIYPMYLRNPEYENDITLIHSTIFDNPFIAESIKTDVLRRAKNDENYRKVYLEGELGNLEGCVFKNWSQINDIDFPKIECVYGLDFGFSSDPSALVKVAKSDGAIYCKELFYETEMHNQDISDRMLSLGLRKGVDRIIADSAEPKSISELRLKGWRIEGAEKGPDSIVFGINTLQQYQIYVTKESLNMIKELRAYSWQKDKNGKPLNKPIDAYCHILDGLRYTISGLHRVHVKASYHIGKHKID